MKNNFHDPIPPNPKRSKKVSPWDFQQPQYDERSSCYVNTGTHYGVGYNNPIGHAGNPKSRVPTLPYGRPNTMEVAQAPSRQLPMETEE